MKNHGKIISINFLLFSAPQKIDIFNRKTEFLCFSSFRPKYDYMQLCQLLLTPIPVTNIRLLRIFLNYSHKKLLMNHFCIIAVVAVFVFYPPVRLADSKCHIVIWLWQAQKVHKSLIYRIGTNSTVIAGTTEVNCIEYGERCHSYNDNRDCLAKTYECVSLWRCVGQCDYFFAREAHNS